MGFSRQEYWSGVPLPSPASKEQTLVITYVCVCVLGARLAQLSVSRNAEDIPLYVGDVDVSRHLLIQLCI